MGFTNRRSGPSYTRPDTLIAFRRLRHGPQAYHSRVVPTLRHGDGRARGAARFYGGLAVRQAPPRDGQAHTLS